MRDAVGRHAQRIRDLCRRQQPRRLIVCHHRHHPSPAPVARLRPRQCLRRSPGDVV